MTYDLTEEKGTRETAIPRQQLHKHATIAKQCVHATMQELLELGVFCVVHAKAT
jgi:hypothetical protein